MTQISFGAKIPIGSCQVLDRKTNNFVGATFYEYNCQDKKDIFEVLNLKRDWDFKHTISCGMEIKHALVSKGIFDRHSYYCLQSDKGEILGVCETEEEHKSINVKYISSDPDKNYKYVGQAMLAILGDNVLNSNKNRLIIENVISSSWDFYEQTCGFKPINENASDLEMNRQDIYKFIKRTEGKTQGQIINFQA